MKDGKIEALKRARENFENPARCRGPGFMSPNIATQQPRKGWNELAVRFQQVVHSSKTREADCDEQSVQPGRPEWTFTRMHDLP